MCEDDWSISKFVVYDWINTLLPYSCLPINVENQIRREKKFWVCLIFILQLAEVKLNSLRVESEAVSSGCTCLLGSNKTIDGVGTVVYEPVQVN